ncbi:MAG: phosphoribosyltransferase [Candidatus Berkelbacteria bacterium]|nr:phosphoribosyltransferase [Candidatus Berkelbacteria bacterium]
MRPWYNSIMAQIFSHRNEAGRLLGQAILRKYPSIKNGIILSLPRGGVVIGSEVAKLLNLPMGIIVTRKIGAPFNSEYAIAAVSEHKIIFSAHEKIDKGYIKRETIKERQEITRRLIKYRGKKSSLNLRGRTVFLVDDGLATGLTMEVAIKEVRWQNPAKVIVAVPVAPPSTIEKLRQKVDDILVLKIEPTFFSVGQFYDNFDQVSDEEVIKLLE